MVVVKDFPKLYGLTSNKKIKEWEIRVGEFDNHIFIVTKHGLQNGKKQIDRVDIKEGKNIGRANETTPKQQALNEAESKWNLKRDKGYLEDIKNIQTNLLPMLAKTYGVIINGKLIKDKNISDKITYPCYVQPKLDGVRCFAKKINGNIEFISRNGKSYQTLSHIEKELNQIMEKEDIFDGEIYINGEEFQDIISAIKNVKNKDKAQLDCNKLEYHIYDIARKDLTFKERYDLLSLKYSNKDLEFIKKVTTIRVSKEDLIQDWHDIFVSQGFEGVIIRNKDGKYKFDFRSDDLQKLKEFFDEEFKIIDVRSGIGRYKKCGIFICETKDGKTFDVNPKGDIEQKEEYLKNKDKYIGKDLMVRFQEKSKDEIPRFGIGIIVRDYE